MTVADSALSIRGLHKSYGSVEVVRDLSLEVERGAIHGLVGLNGSGKTTTLECTLGLQGFDKGQVSLLGKSPDRLYEARGAIVGIFDSPSLNPNLTVRQCLQQAALLLDTQAREAAEVERLLGIERFRDYRVRNLSLGNKRRVSIAHALLGNPELILLDEPFNGLDAGGVDDVLALIARLNAEFGTSFLLSSHQLPYLERVCSHIAILHRGHIANSASISELLAQTGSRVLLRTPQLEAAKALLHQHTQCELQELDSDGYLPIELTATDSATLNRLLVQQQIPVEELILERASLEVMFRQITREGET